MLRWELQELSIDVVLRVLAMSKPKPNSVPPILVRNPQAPHYYHLLERFEAGIKLTGTEVKTIREGKVSLRESYALIKNDEAWLYNCHVTPYLAAGRFNHEALRIKKLLMHKTEIRRLYGKTRERGFTLIPTQLYLKKNFVKCEIALAKGKNVHDKREMLRRKTIDREAEQAMREHQKQ